MRKMSVKAMAASSAVIWGGSVLTIGIINSVQPKYGGYFLQWASSIYPGYKAGRTPKDIAIGTGYAALDGAACGALFALLYNALA